MLDRASMGTRSGRKGLGRRSEYEQFLASKRILAAPCGFDVDETRFNPMLMPFQRDICRWALRRGKAAVFAHTGLGKGPIQLIGADWFPSIPANRH